MSLQTVLYFLLLAGAFALMMRFGCGAHVMGRNGNRENSSNDTGGVRATNQPAEATDPVCGMNVQTTQAKSAAYEGHVYYFCSPACREKFEAAPATCVKPGVAGLAEQKEHHHGTCC